MTSSIKITTSMGVNSGDLIKNSSDTVYYYGRDSKRHVFPDEKTYFSWYNDFSAVKNFSDDELAVISLGNNVTYRPGVRMLKINTDPKVYAVDAHGALRWIVSEALAKALYGVNWQKQINDISDAFFINYKIGAPINKVSDFNPAQVTAEAVNINWDKNL